MEKKKKPVPKGLIPFVKGDPRINRKGAPKKVVRLQKLMSEILGTEPGEPIKESDLGKIIVGLVTSAQAGNVLAAKEILDRLYGRSSQVVRLEKEDDDKDKIDYSKLSDAALKEIISARGEE